MKDLLRYPLTRRQLLTYAAGSAAGTLLSCVTQPQSAPPIG